MGENIGSARTVINGGFATFFVDTRNDSGSVDGPVNFEMLESRGAVYTFVNYKACNGASITDLKIYDLLPAFPTQIYPYGFACGIVADNYRDDFFPVVSRDKIRGDFFISRCRVEFLSNTADVVCNAGIFFATFEANVTVSESQVYNFSAGLDIADGGGAINVTGCCLMTSRIALGMEILRLSKGIAVNTLGPVDISHNRIFIDGSGYKDVPVQVFAVSLVEDTGGVSVGNNHITASTNKAGQSDYYGFHFMIWSDNVTCSDNVLCGTNSLSFFTPGNNNWFIGNDLTGLTTTCLGVDCGGNSNVFEGNTFGPHTAKDPVIWCSGNNNIFSHNDFRMTGARGFSLSSNHVNRGGCILLDRGTSDNEVNALVSDFGQELGPQYDPCTQVVDLAYGNNTVNLEVSPGVPASCDSNQYLNLIHMLSQNQEYLKRKAEIEAKLAEQLGMIEGW